MQSSICCLQQCELSSKCDKDLFCDAAETVEVDIKAEWFVFIFNKKYGCSVKTGSRPEKSYVEILINEFLKGFLFGEW